MQKISFHFIDYYRNFNKKDDGNNIHSDLNSGNNGQIRKNSGLNVVNSIDEEEEDDCKTKNLAKYLGMKDGTSVSISSQVKKWYLTHFLFGIQFFQKFHYLIFDLQNTF